MATRGVKPKPAHLRLVDGTRNATRHGSEEKLRGKVRRATAAFGKLTRPKDMDGEIAKAWDRYIKPAGWLDGSREPAAIAFCILWAQFREYPGEFPASKLGQMRALMSELGLTDERNRVEKEDEERDEFFDD